jgi:hypothetical protein
MLGQPGRLFEAYGLYHETRHGLYFTEPTYARACREYWNGVLSADQREAFRLALLSMDYDSADEELMINEWQAYVLTPAHQAFGSIALTTRLRDIAAGRFRSRNLNYADVSVIRRQGTRLAADIEEWMADDLRRWLGGKWNIPSAAEVESFRTR